MSEKIYGLLLLPYQYIQLIGYRLVGVPCRYELGNFGVGPLKPVTRAQHRVAKLFPPIVVGLGWVLQIAIVVFLSQLYQARMPLIPLLFVLLSTPPLALYLHYVRFDWKQKSPQLDTSRPSPQRGKG